MNNKGKARTLLDKAVRDAEYREDEHLRCGVHEK